MNGAKVVGIHGGSPVARAGGNGPLPAPLVKLRDVMKLKLQDLLRKLFDSADDALFTMADKAGTNGDQAVYFDAMRELRLQKKTVATELIRGLIKSFNELGEYRAKNDLNDNSLNDWDDVSLVQNDELELDVAVEAMVARLRNTAGSNLSDFKARIESLVPDITLADDQIPLCPEMLCDCFLDGCTALDVEIKARLVVLKLFEKYVLSEMTKLYIEGNQLLIQQGILPALKADKAKAKRHSKPSNPSSVNHAPPGMNNNSTNAAVAGQNQVSSNMQSSQFGSDGSGNGRDNVPVLNADQCLSEGQFERIRQLMRTPAMHAESSDNKVGQNVQYFTQADLVSALSNVQHQQLSQVSSFANSNSVIDYRQLLESSLPKASGRENYSELDSDVINLVSMLFDFILDDRQLQPVMKALISRLQIPILKVAIMDRSFFDRGGHPARKLLNVIASAAIGWNEKPEGKPDRLKDKVEHTVQTILTQFDNDQSLFSTLLEEFSSFVDLELRRGQLVEQRTKDSERGKAASDVAKKAVQKILNESMQNKSVPASVVELLREAWSRVMVLQYLKEGEQSAAWRSACDLLNDLIWTVCPEGADDEARSKLVLMIPTVMKRLRTGLEQISFDDFQAGELLKSLENEHIRTLQALQRKSSSDPEDNMTQSSDAHLNQLNYDNENGSDSASVQDEAASGLALDTLEIEEEFKNFQQASLRQENTDQAEPDDGIVFGGSREEQKSVEIDEKSVEQSVQQEEIILTPVDKEPVLYEIDESDPFVRQVGRLAPGCWFEFQNEDRPERCKLAAIIKATGKYIFVNRSGVKVAEKTKMGLAIELRRGSVQVLNDGLLFDRALESVIGSLRSKKNK